MDKPEETPAEKMNRKKFELCCERLGERIQGENVSFIAFQIFPQPQTVFKGLFINSP